MGEGWPSKRKYITMNVTFFVALAAFAMTFAVVMIYKPNIPVVGDLDRLEKGMTRLQVTQILGPPDMSVSSTMGTGDEDLVWTYALHASHWSVTKTHYQVRFYEGKLDSWYKVK